MKDMDKELMDTVEKVFDKVALPIGISILGAIIHTYRTKNDPTRNKGFLGFFMLIFINISVVFTVGIISEDYLEVKNDRIVWVISGVACTFSVYILNLIQFIIQDIAPDIARKFFNIEKKED